MMNNPGVMPPQGQPPAPVQQQTAAVSQQALAQSKQRLNDEILANCLQCTQNLRECLQTLLNCTKQAANIESDDQSSSTASSATTNLPSNNMNTNLKANIDRKLIEMSKSFDQLSASIEQYDFKFLQNQQLLINHYNELSYENKGALIDEWSIDVKWAEKLAEIYQSIQPNTQLYRRSNQRNLNTNLRSRIDGPSSTIIDRVINQFETIQQQQQQQATKDYIITVQRLSDHLNIIEFSLLRSGLVIYLYLRHCTIEHVIVKPLNEKKQLGNYFNPKLVTNHKVLDIIAGHIRAVAVYFSPFGAQADQALQKTLNYIHKYQALHAQKCTNCQKHLLNGLQPTWRDVKMNDCYHEECLS